MIFHSTIGHNSKLICWFGKTIDLLVDKVDLALLKADSKSSDQTILSLEDFPAIESSRGESG